MRHSAIIAGLVSVCLVSACTTVANAPSTPDPVESPAGSQNAGNTDPAPDNPFPPLAKPQPGQPLQVAEYFQDPGSGLKVADVSISGGTDENQDGSIEYTTQGRIDLGSQGVHEVEIAEEDAPASGDRPDVYTVTDKTDGSSFVFELSADGRTAALRQGEVTLSVGILEDERFTVNGGEPVAADTGAQQALDAGLDGKLSPHALALLYAKMLRTPVEPSQAYRLQTGLSPRQWLNVLGLNFIYVLIQIILALRGGVH